MFLAAFRNAGFLESVMSTQLAVIVTWPPATTGIDTLLGTAAYKSNVSSRLRI
jgi:hypothetical protein